MELSTDETQALMWALADARDNSRLKAASAYTDAVTETYLRQSAKYDELLAKVRRATRSGTAEGKDHDE